MDSCLREGKGLCLPIAVRNTIVHPTNLTRKHIKVERSGGSANVVHRVTFSRDPNSPAQGGSPPGSRSGGIGPPHPIPRSGQPFPVSPTLNENQSSSFDTVLFQVSLKGFLAEQVEWPVVPPRVNKSDWYDKHRRVNLWKSLNWGDDKIRSRRTYLTLGQLNQTLRLCGEGGSGTAGLGPARPSYDVLDTVPQAGSDGLFLLQGRMKRPPLQRLLLEWTPQVVGDLVPLAVPTLEDMYFTYLDEDGQLSFYVEGHFIDFFAAQPWQRLSLQDQDQYPYIGNLQVSLNPVVEVERNAERLNLATQRAVNVLAELLHLLPKPRPPGQPKPRAPQQSPPSSPDLTQPAQRRIASNVDLLHSTLDLIAPTVVELGEHGKWQAAIDKHPLSLSGGGSTPTTAPRQQ